jgi:hypothetical protein
MLALTGNAGYIGLVRLFTVKAAIFGIRLNYTITHYVRTHVFIFFVGHAFSPLKVSCLRFFMPKKVKRQALLSDDILTDTHFANL